MNKPFSQACVNNREPITAVLERLLAEGQRVLEIGSGTGQHAVWIGQQIPSITWQTSDRCENHSAIQQWVAESNLTNVYPPIALDVAIDPWPDSQFDMIFSSNTAHIMAWQDVEKCFNWFLMDSIREDISVCMGPCNTMALSNTPAIAHLIKS